MRLTSSIQPYDPKWPQQYANEEARLRPIFGPALVEIHHVGSTAIPELAAKGEIDILAVIDPTGTVEDWSRSFEMLGYRRGGDLSLGHLSSNAMLMVFAHASSTFAAKVMRQSLEC